jgi:hypothetical protein
MTLAALGAILAFQPLPAFAAEPDKDKPAEQKPAPRAPAQDKTAAKKRQAPPPSAAPLRFTDDDLEKYKKPAAPVPDDEIEDESEVVPAAPVGSPQGPVPAVLPKPGTPKPVAPKPAASKPVPPAPSGMRTRGRAEKLPDADPLKPWKDREALETLRNEQIRGLRERMTSLQEQLTYLEQKRLAIIDPLRVMPKPRTPEEGEQDATRKSREVLDSVEAEIETVKSDLDQAKRDLIGVETRFEQETSQR